MLGAAALEKTLSSSITKSLTATPTSLHSIVGSAGSFRDAVNRFETFQQEHLAPNNLEFGFVTLDSWDLRVQVPTSPRGSSSKTLIATSCNRLCRGHSMPFSYPNQHTFAYGQPLPSPQSYGQYSGRGDASNQHGSAMSIPYSSLLRAPHSLAGGDHKVRQRSFAWHVA